jgi:small subunit ribosomal protein S17e
MGRIKTTMIKRAAEQVVAREPDLFNENFEHNKKMLGNNTMPSKRIRNKVAGHIGRIKKNTKKLLDTEVLG